MDNGGLRPEYDRYNKNQLATFYSGLRKNEKSPVKYLKDPLKDRADITSYLNWPSMRARLESIKTSQAQATLVDRLHTSSPKGSPKRVRAAFRRDKQDSGFKSVTPRRPQFIESIDS